MRLALACLALAAVPAASLDAQSASSVFPMEKGTYWVYSGSVEWQENGPEVHRAELSWKSEVLDSIERGRIKVALLVGDPRDLTWYEQGKKRGCYLLTSVDDRQFYMEQDITFKEPDCVLPKRDFSDLPGIERLFLKLPIQTGDSFGADPELPKREDGLYAWNVESRRTVTLGGIKGVPKKRTFEEYVLTYRTRPDHEIVTYVPGVGLTEYEYSHHGTVSEVHMQLVEFHANPR